MLVSENQMHLLALPRFSPGRTGAVERFMAIEWRISGRSGFVRPLQPPQQQGITFGQFVAGVAVAGAGLWGSRRAV